MKASSTPITSLDSASARAKLTRLASSPNPEVATLARILQSLVPHPTPPPTLTIPSPETATPIPRHLHGMVQIDGSVAIPKNSLDVNYHSALEIIQEAIGNPYLKVSEIWVTLSTAGAREEWTTVTPESWSDILPLIRKVTTYDPCARLMASL